MRRSIFLYGAVLLAGLCGCSGLAGRAPSAVPIDDRSTVYLPEQAQVSRARTPQSGRKDEDPVRLQAGSPAGGPVAAGSEAVLALLRDAEKMSVAGKIEHAAASIERALSIEPKNALLWSRLAAVRLRQKDWQQAFIIANKSNSLARDNPALQIENWRIIEKARYEQGDQEASRAARKKIKKLIEMREAGNSGVQTLK